jgi:hypothetical protein
MTSARMPLAAVMRIVETTSSTTQTTALWSTKDLKKAGTLVTPNVMMLVFAAST